MREEQTSDELIDLGAATELTHGDPIDFEDEGQSRPNKKYQD